MKVLCVFLVLVIAFPASYAHAHTTIEVGPYEIEAGWGTEPPIEGLRNTVVYSVTETGEVEGVRKGVVGAFSNASVTLIFGGIEKQAEILNDPRAGAYYTKIIPSSAGSYHVGISGHIGDVAVNEVIPIEDVLRTAALDFPPRSSSGDADLAALRNALAAVQRDLDARGEPEEARGGIAYDIALFGAALGVAGTVLAVTAMIKKR